VSLSRNLFSRWWTASLLGLSLTGGAFAACSDGGGEAAGPAGTGTEATAGGPTGTSGASGAPSTQPCERAEAGCVCPSEGVVVDCGNVHQQDGEYVYCVKGNRTCQGGLWSACVPDSVAPQRFKLGERKAPGVGFESLASPTNCVDNPCDPYCVQYDDDPAGLDLDAGIADGSVKTEGKVVNDGGITLSADPPQAPPACTGLAIAPKPTTPPPMTITQVAPVVSSPAYIDYDATLTPAGCYNGTVQPLWSIDRLDYATIDAAGIVRVQSGVATKITVRAYLGALTAAATFDVNVTSRNVEASISATTANKFKNADGSLNPGTTADTMTVLYPYADTVFPLKINPPRVMWDKGGSNGDAWRVEVRYPAVPTPGQPSFSWSYIRPDTPIPALPAAPGYAIPAGVWQAFEQTAKGAKGAIVTQRVVAGTLRKEIVRPVQFGNGSLKGKIYYTEYYSGSGTHAFIRALDPSASTNAVNAFQANGESGGNQCPVCHSVSANGRIFATSNRSWSSNGGISRINADGTFTNLTDMPGGTPHGVDWRGFAWAALTPTGSYALSGDNVWGNTGQPSPAGVVSAEQGGNGFGLSGRYCNGATPGTASSGSCQTRVDPFIDKDWGSAAPGPTGINADNFTVRWEGLLEIADPGTYTFRTTTDDGVKLHVSDTTTFDATPIIDQLGGIGTYSAAKTLTAGKHHVRMDYRELTGGAKAKLEWSSALFGFQTIPSAVLYAAESPPTSGLAATYYQTRTFSSGSFDTAPLRRFDATVNFDWGSGSPAAGFPADSFSARHTGRIKWPCTGTVRISTISDDGTRLWLDGSQRIESWYDQGPTQRSADIAVVSGQLADLRIDYYENGGGATLKLLWQGVGGACTFAEAAVPSTALTPTSATTYSVAPDRDRGTGNPMTIWRLSDQPNVTPVNATPEKPSQWGLGSTAMLVPAFSPDGTKLVFVTGDSGEGAGWRKGLGTFDFNEGNKAFTNKRLVRNHWPAGDVIKWPAFESDSRSVIFQATPPGENCNGCSTKYGHMAPTNYYATSAKLWSIDTGPPGSTGPSTPVELARLNVGERAIDADKAFQPTALPKAAAGYRWAVFASTRPYGNYTNVPGTSCLVSQLWVAAIDDTPSAGVDRSHPAFWLPNQYVGINSGGNSCGDNYINERAFWALDACTPVGTGAANECEVTEDCCGGTGANPTSVCRIDTPIASPIKRHCSSFVPAVCVNEGAVCGGDGDCCNFPSLVCASGTCQVPPTPPHFTQGKFSRDFEAVCKQGDYPKWRLFEWKTATPLDSSVTFEVATADTDPLLETAPLTFLAKETDDSNATTFHAVEISQKLPGQISKRFLRVTATLTPSADGEESPVLLDWRQSYDCVPAE
jgi:hypothetical protein